MARGRRPKHRHPARRALPPALPRRLGLASITGHVAAFLEAGGRRLLRWVAAALMRRLARAGVGEAAGRGDGEKLLNDDIDESAESEADPSSAIGAPLVQEDAAEGSASAAAAVEQDGAGEDCTAAALQEDGTAKNSAGTASTATLAQDDEPSEDRAAAAKSSAAHEAGKTATSAAKNGVGTARERPKRRGQPAAPRPRSPPPPPRPRSPPVRIPSIPSAPLFVALVPSWFLDWTLECSVL